MVKLYLQSYVFFFNAQKTYRVLNLKFSTLCFCFAYSLKISLLR